LEVTASELNGFGQARRGATFEVIGTGPEWSETVDLSSYRDIIDSYRQGSFVAAARRLSRSPWRSVRSSVNNYGKQSLSDGERKTAAMLHTDAALLNRMDESQHMKTVRDHFQRMNDVATRRDFERRWVLTISQYLQSSLRYENALNMMERALKVYPDDLELHMAIAKACEKTGWEGDDRQLDRAQREYRRILQKDPENDEARMRLGRMLHLKGRTEEAIAEIERSLSHSDDREIQLIANIILGNIYNQRGELSEEIESFRAAVGVDPQCQVAAIALSHALHRAGDLDGSREVMEQLLTHPGTVSGAADPWWRFLRADSDRFDTMMEALREDVRP
jgi:tetratricopeptide (TPR) repeat protein